MTTSQFYTQIPKNNLILTRKITSLRITYQRSDLNFLTYWSYLFEITLSNRHIQKCQELKITKRKVNFLTFKIIQS